MAKLRLSCTLLQNVADGLWCEKRDLERFLEKVDPHREADLHRDLSTQIVAMGHLAADLDRLLDDCGPDGWILEIPER